MIYRRRGGKSGRHVPRRPFSLVSLYLRAKNSSGTFSRAIGPSVGVSSSPFSKYGPPTLTTTLDSQINEANLYFGAVIHMVMLELLLHYRRRPEEGLLCPRTPEADNRWGHFFSFSFFFSPQMEDIPYFILYYFSLISDFVFRVASYAARPNVLLPNYLNRPLARLISCEP